MDMNGLQAALHLAGLVGVFAVAGFLADHVLPHIKPLMDLLEGLPLLDDLGDVQDVEINTGDTESGHRAA